MRILFVLIGLLAVVFLAHIFMSSEEKQPVGAEQVIPADVGDTASVSATAQQLRPIPEAQLTVIKDVFAPELKN